MNDPKMVWPPRGPGGPEADSSRSWTALGWIGAVFLLVGGLDFLLTWYPLALGSREWEFATVTQSFNGLPILLLGVGLLTVSAEPAGRRWWALVGVTVAAVLLVWVVAGFALWVGDVGLALETVPDDLRSGIQKAVTKTAVQSVVYPVVLAYLVRLGWGAWKAG